MRELKDWSFFLTSRKKVGDNKWIAFEVSSEGELDSSFAVIEAALERGYFVELLYCSLSLEAKIKAIRENYQDRIFPVLLPLTLAGLPLFLLKSKTLFFTRYDFFPELFLFFKRYNILSATLKNKKLKGLEGRLLKLIYGGAATIVAASKRDQELFKEKIGICSPLCFEFRFLQILKRVRAEKEALSRYPELLDKLNAFKSSEAKFLILGSSWDQELSALDEKIAEMIRSNELSLLVAPHKLSKENIDNTVQALKERLKLSPTLFSRDSVDSAHSNLVVVAIPQLLLEMYTFADFAYVGGGHGRSVHSLLEPFVAGLNLFCGPKVHRSTEYDLIVGLEESAISIVHSPQDFSKKLVQKIEKRPNSRSFTKIEEDSKIVLEKIFYEH